MRRLIFACMAFALVLGVAVSQSGADIDVLLSAGEVGAGLAARFALPAADLVPENIGIADAFAWARDKGWLPGIDSAESPLTMAQLSFLVMNSFGMKGGILYGLFPGPRYAYRELVYLKVIQGLSDPSRIASGEALMRLLGRMLDRKEAGL